MSRTADSRGGRGQASDLACLAGFAVLTLVMTWPLAREFSRAIPGDGFDGWQNYWNLWWVRVALIVQHKGPFFTDLLFYPTGASLLFHTLNVFNGIVSMPVQLAFGLFTAYNAVVLLSFTMGGFGAYLLARWVLGRNGSRVPAFVAGVVFSFSPFHFAHLLGHMQVISLEWIPFYALYLLRLLRPDRQSNAKNAGELRKNVWMAAFFLVLIGLCDLYYVLYCLIFTVLLLGWAGWRRWCSRASSVRVTVAPTLPTRSAGLSPRGSPLAQAVLLTGAVWILFGVILSPQLAPMVIEARRSDYMVPDPAESRLLSADLAAFVTPQEFHPLWGAWAARLGSRLASSPAEHQVFAGFAVLGLAALGLWSGWAGPKRRRADLGPWPLILLAFFILALGPVLHSGGRPVPWPGGGQVTLPYAWLTRVVPFMAITRSVSRFDVMVMLSLGILAAAGVQWLWERGKAGRLAGFAALGLILFEFWPAPYPMTAPDIPQWYTDLARESRPGAVLNLPMAWDRPGYLLHQTVHGKPLTVAYISRDDPRTLTERAPVLQHFRHLGPDIIQFDLAAQGKQVLSDIGARWVVLDRYQMPSGEEREYTEMAAQEIFGHQPPAYQDERITVYEVAETPGTTPYLVLGENWDPLNPTARARSFQGSATVIVRSPADGQVTLRVNPAPGSAPLALPGSKDGYALSRQVRPGDNVIELSALGANPLAIIASLSLDPQNKENAK